MKLKNIITILLLFAFVVVDAQVKIPFRETAKPIEIKTDATAEDNNIFKDTDGELFYKSGAVVRRVSDLLNYEISAAQTITKSGFYKIVNGGFTVTLADVEGLDVTFLDPNRFLTANNVTVAMASATDAITDGNGIQQVGQTILLDTDNEILRVYRTGGNLVDYFVDNENTVTVPPLFSPTNGAYNALTNDPDITDPANQQNGSAQYVYPIEVAGTAGVGTPSLAALGISDGTALDVGDQIFWYGTTWFIDKNSAKDDPVTQLEAEAGTETQTRAWSPERVHDAINSYKYIRPVDGSTLETGKKYIVTTETVNAPVAPQDGDFFYIKNDSPVVKAGGGDLDRGMLVGDLILPDGTQIPQFSIVGGVEFLLTYSATSTRWTAAVMADQIVNLNNTHDGLELRGGVIYEIDAPVANMSFKTASVPVGKIEIRLANGSSFPITIEQFNTGGTQQFRFEDNTVNNTFDISLDLVGQKAELIGNPSIDRWYVYRDWVINDDSSIAWYTNIAEQAVESRLNIYPEGSSLTAHVAPDYILNGSYSIVTGDQGTGELNPDQQDYISNGLASGSGGAWIKKVEKNSQILQNITVNGVGSNGTNASSNVAFTFLDIDGNTYPNTDWAVTYASTGLDKAVFTSGSISLGHNKPAAPAIFEYIGDTPNGISRVNVTGTNNGFAGSTAIINFEGTNFNEVIATNTTTSVIWTTFSMPDANDQAAPILELVQYNAGDIISFKEPDAADPDYQTLFNWQVLAGQTITNTEITDITSEAELLAIKPKLERFGVGSTLNQIPRLIAVDYVVSTPTLIPNSGAGFDRFMYIGNTTDVIYQFDASGSNPTQITDQPSTRWADGALVEDLATSTVYKYVRNTNKFTIVPSSDGLRGSPVANDAALTALTAKNFEKRKVESSGKIYIFSEGAVSGDLADDGATGFWNEEVIYATVASNEIGTLKQVPNVDETGTAMTNAGYVANGLLPLVNGYTLTDGATNNPKFALMFPTFVSGNDLVVPSTFSGDFVRNLGGNAAAFMISQADEIQSHNHAGGKSVFGAEAAFGTTGNFGGGNDQTSNWDSGSSTKPLTSSVGGVETRPENFAMQFCLVLDSYSRVLLVDVDLVPVADNLRIIVQGQPPSTGNINFDVGSFVITDAGEYEWTAKGSGRATQTGRVTYQAEIRDAANGAGNVVDGGVMQINLESQNNFSYRLSDAHGQVFLAAGTYYYHANRNTGGVDGDDIFNMTLRKVPKTVEQVDPNLVPIENLSRIQVGLSATVNNSALTHYAFDQVDFTQGSELSLSGTGSIQGLQAGKTYKITASIQQQNAGAAPNADQTFRFIDLTNDAQIGRLFENYQEFGMSSQVAFITPSVTTEVGLDFTGGDKGEIGIKSSFTVEEVVSKTVIRPEDIVVTDQAASGYIDIGTTRIQWSDEVSSTGGTVVFPQPFASTPVITATSTQNAGHNIAVLTKSATQFTFDQWDVNNTQQNGTWNWIAIGVKP